ncbi:MAG TPA: YcxB family protein [Sedimentisphaerales bacterium]|nr:YcxB family protein [Sedimentisphaerales bacterium]
MRGGSRVWALRGFALLTFALALIEWYSGRPSGAAGLAMAGGATLLLPRTYWGLVAGRFRRIVTDPQNAHLLGRKTLTLTPEGLHIADAGEAGYLAWGNIVRAARTEDHIFLVFSTLQAVVIPRASLEGASFETVWTTATTYLDRHHERGTRQGSESTATAAIQGTPASVFSYRLEESDWTAFTVHHRRSKAQGRHRWLARFAVLPIPLLLVILGVVRPPVNWDLVVLFLGLSVLCFLFYPRVLDNAALRQAEYIAGNSANVHCLGERRIALSPEWLHVQGSGVQSTFTWPSVVKAERTDDHIFIYMSTSEALIIPRASLDGASFEDVWTRANEYLDHSRDNPKRQGSA